VYPTDSDVAKLGAADNLLGNLGLERRGLPSAELIVQLRLVPLAAASRPADRFDEFHLKGVSLATVDAFS
jgi:hypothetical protein